MNKNHRLYQLVSKKSKMSKTGSSVVDQESGQHIDKSNHCVKALVSASVYGLALFCASHVVAQPLDPVEELIFFGQNDHLILDRGGPVDGVGDVNGDGFDDLVIGSGVGGIRVVFGPTQGNNGILNISQINGTSGFIIVHDDVNISHVSSAGDLNADGLDDVMVGSLGGAHVVFGRADGFQRQIDVTDLTGADGFSFDSPATSISNAGDVNGDGIDDIIIGNSTAGANDLSGAGVSYVIYGQRAAYPPVLNPASLNGANGFAVLGTNTEDRSGRFVGAAGDFNHDGVDDFMIGAPNKTQNANAEVGEAYVLYGRAGGFPAAISLSDIDGRNGFVFRGSNIQDLAGSSVTGIGDLNHDGITDLAIGAPGKGPFGSPTDYPGEVYVLFGGEFDGVALVNEQSLNGTNGFVARGIRGGVVPIEEDQAIWGDLAGTSVDGAGDFNNDGIDDLLIGASHTIINPRRKGVGQIYIIYGTTAAFPARFNLSDLDGDNGFRINGIGTTDYFGVYSRQGGDFNADGRPDIVIGASGQGNSYVIYGRDPWAEVQPPAAPVGLRAASTPGFSPIAFNPMPNEDFLLFNELRDPTGPNPLPVGTPVLLGDSGTPGDIRPNIVAPVAPLRPGVQQIVPETVVAVPEVTPVAVPEVTEEAGGTQQPQSPTPVATPTAVSPSTSPPTNPTTSTIVTPVEPIGTTQTQATDASTTSTTTGLVSTGGGAFWMLSLAFMMVLRARKLG